MSSLCESNTNVLKGEDLLTVLFSLSLEPRSETQEHIYVLLTGDCVVASASVGSDL